MNSLSKRHSSIYLNFIGLKELLKIADPKHLVIKRGDFIAMVHTNYFVSRASASFQGKVYSVRNFNPQEPFYNLGGIFD